MTSWVAMVKLPSQTRATALADALETLNPPPLGVACLEVEDGSGLHEVAGYFNEKPDEIALLLLCAAHEAEPFAISKLDERDWVAQVRRELTPVRAGKFLVYGRHDRSQLWISDRGLEIEAAMAFGTGHHGTTLGCLQLANKLESMRFEPAQIADIGTGTGILAMGARRLWPNALILASDIEEISVATARANFKVNRANSVHVFQAHGFCHSIYRNHAPFDLIFANILARPLKNLAPEMARNCNKGGFIILSGILNRQAASVLAVYREHQFILREKRKIGEWTSLCLEKY